MRTKIKVVLFDFDNTIANTESIRQFRESGNYDGLTAESMAKVRVYRKIEALLPNLRKCGVKLGLVTNAGQGYIDRVFRHLNLVDAFDAVVTYTDVKADGKKPSPAGIKLVMEKLGISPSPEILYIGDENSDHIAAYRAGITPVMPAWSTKTPVSMAPALEMSSDMVLDYVQNPEEYRLFAERCADANTIDFPRKEAHFLPLDSSGNVVTVREEMTAFCFGRYFSQKAAVTAYHHDRHALSKAIAKKEEQDPFEIPKYWVDLLSKVIQPGANYFFKGEGAFDIVTVIPAKQGKDPRLERMLDLIKAALPASPDRPSFIKDVFIFAADARSQKTLTRQERSIEARKSLHLNSGKIAEIGRKNILIIDDVITTGATLARAQSLLKNAGALTTTGIAIAKTVSIMEDERPCPVCGRAMKVRKNKITQDRFWGCTGYLEKTNACKHTEPLIKKDCPTCGRLMRIQTNRKTQEKFWSCTGYNQTPSCNFSQDVEAGDMPG